MLLNKIEPFFDLEIIEKFDFIKDLETRGKLLIKNIDKLSSLCDTQEDLDISLLKNEISRLKNIVENLDMDYVTSYGEKGLNICFGNDAVAEIKGSELYELINLSFYFIVKYNIEQIDINQNIYIVKDWNGDGYTTLITIKSSATAEQIKKAKDLANKTWESTENWKETFHNILNNENIDFETIKTIEII